MGVEPTTSRVRFQLGAQRSTDITRKTSQFKTYVADYRRNYGANSQIAALVLGQKADNLGYVFANWKANALLIAHLMACSNPMLHKNFSTPVRELSVSFKQGDGNERTEICRSRFREVPLVRPRSLS
jgi:hypothetical protein